MIRVYRDEVVRHTVDLDADEAITMLIEGSSSWQFEGAADALQDKDEQELLELLEFEFPWGLESQLEDAVGETQDTDDIVFEVH